jgi:hypothetical protein
MDWAPIIRDRNALLFISKVVGISLFLSNKTDYFTAGVISEFMTIFDNHVTVLVFMWLKKQAQFWMRCVTHQNTYNHDLVKTFCILSLTWLICQNMVIVTVASLMFQYFAKTTRPEVRSLRKKIFTYPHVFNFVSTWSNFSYYNPIHTLGVCLLFYLWVNLSNYKEIPIPDTKIDLLKSYYPLKENMLTR